MRRKPMSNLCPRHLNKNKEAKTKQKTEKPFLWNFNDMKT